MKISFYKSFLILVSFGLSALVVSNQLSAQSDMEEEDKFSFSLSLNSDQFFGYYPVFAGAYSLNETTDFTFYGILWSGGVGENWGNWTEFGVGASFQVSDALSVNPQLGITGGTLLSSGATGAGRLGDGIVPNLTIGLDDSQVEGQIYIGYYAPLRDEAPETGTTLSYLHYWINGGYKASDFFSLGAHFEHLINSGGSNVDESTDVYQWFGPYIQFTDPSGKVSTRFAFGTDLVEANDSFYKLTVGLSF